jgi:hypothetical protein
VGWTQRGFYLALPVNSAQVDWNTVKRVLARIGEISGDFLEENILIGGGAAWFYRSLLEVSSDRDFRAPDFSDEDNRIWLSKDIDFIGTKREEISDRLGLPCEGDPPAARIDGIWIDSPNEGLYLTFQRALPTALTTTLPEGKDFLVASPILLHREKTELILRKNRPQDRLHLETFLRASRLVLCQLMEIDEYTRTSCRELFRLLKEAQEISPGILADPNMKRRALAGMERMRGHEACKSVLHLLEKQILTLMSESLQGR